METMYGTVPSISYLSMQYSYVHNPCSYTLVVVTSSDLYYQLMLLLLSLSTTTSTTTTVSTLELIEFLQITYMKSFYNKLSLVQNMWGFDWGFNIKLGVQYFVNTLYVNQAY